jgi:hypothetical protein
MDSDDISQPVKLYVRPNEGKGDCLFHSIAQALNDYSAGSTAAALWAHAKRMGLTPGTVTATQLRVITYMLFLVSRPDVDMVLDMWRTMLGASPELSVDVPQARGLPDKPAVELTQAERLSLFSACMNPAVCWGDETAMAFLERLLGIRCMVIVGKHMQTRSSAQHPEGFTPFVYIPLSLMAVHYRNIAWADDDGVQRGAFAEEELPDILLYLAQRDCSAVPEPYINLRHRISARMATVASEIPPVPVFTADSDLMAHFRACYVVFSAAYDVTK